MITKSAMPKNIKETMARQCGEGQGEKPLPSRERRRSAKRCSAILALLIFIGLPALAQSPRINVKHLDKLSKKTNAHVEVALDGRLLKMAIRKMEKEIENEKEKEEFNKIFADIKGVYVHVLSFFGKQNLNEDIEIIKRQIETPPWERPVKIRNTGGEDVGIYLLPDPDKDIIKGLVVLVTAGRSLIFVNVVGNVDLYDFDKISGNFGVPKVNMKVKGQDD